MHLPGISPLFWCMLEGSWEKLHLQDLYMFRNDIDDGRIVFAIVLQDGQA